MILEVFGSEDGFSAFWSEIVEPALDSLDLKAGEHDIKPVWSFARP